jgi:diguanylate cyclase (GGDEF)-like protein/PAS domain S-box-containing protein
MEADEAVVGRVVGLLVPGRGRRWFSVNSHPVREGSAVIGAVLSYTDITEARAATEALREREHRYRQLVDHAPLAYLVTDLNGITVEANREVARLLGYEQHELIGISAIELTPDDDLDMIQPLLLGLFDGTRDRVQVDHRLRRRDGTEVWIAATMSLLTDTDGQPDSVLLLGLDVTERRHAELELRASETRFRSLAESLPVGVYRTDALGHMVYVNPRWFDVTGLGADETQAPHRDRNVHPDDRHHVDSALAAPPGAEGPNAVQYRIVDDDGRVRWVRARGGAVLDGDGHVDGYIGSIEDITPLMEAQEQSTRLANIVERTSDLVGVIDWETDELIYLNHAGRALFGVDEAAVPGLSIYDLYPSDLGPESLENIIATLRRGEPWIGELPMFAADGSVVHVWQTLSVTKWLDDEPHHISAVGRDVTDRRRFEEELAWQATHDPLTALPNRSLLLDHLDMALARARRDHKMVALLFLDLDRFKQVNDSLGHEVGDQLLCTVAARLAEAVRPTDTVSRLGGDEFVVLCEDIDNEDHAVEVAQRVAASVEVIPFSVGGTELSVSASVGIALSSGDESHPEVLLRDADAAMYRAKDLGRARLEMFDEGMRQRSARRTELADQLAGGIENDHIVVHFQPGVCLRTGAIISVEALARWNHPDKGLLSPDEFITIAEETGLIVGLGLAVLSKACQEARRWELRFGDVSPTVHVNLSARQLTSGNLPALVRGVLHATELSPAKLCLEITESVLMEDASSAVEMLEALKAEGVSLAIDDFGTGYSSLSYLRRFPVDVLKVDRSFVDGLGPDPEDSAIVAAIVGLAHTLDLQAVAEGVETPEQLAALQRLGCHGAQGFYFARPLPAAQLGDLLGTRFTLS